MESLPNPIGYFFGMLSSWKPVLFVILVWIMNGIIVRRGAVSIEAAVKVFVPLMWVFMIALIVRGVTLAGGVHGVWMLFTPDFEVMRDPAVWQGAFSQIFFTLSLGFGILTAYSSYLPKESDQTNNALLTSFLNCGFEYIAGLAIFSILFAITVVPQASTLAMMFFVVPGGIAQFPGGDPMVVGFGILFFLLLLLAGLSSSVSLIEGLASALIDKFHVSRRRAVTLFCVLGALGSCLFALPQVVNPGLENDGTLGLTLLDLIDHWAFSYGLLIVGLLECLLLGWIYGVLRIREEINRHSRWNLGSWYDGLIKYVIPLLLIFVLGYAVVQEFTGGLYGLAFGPNFAEGWGWLAGAPWAVLLIWIGTTVGLAALFTSRGSYDQE